jgi:hypothetical protein
MTIELRLEYANLADAAPALAALAALGGNVQVSGPLPALAAAASTDEAPKPRGKGKKAQTALEQQQAQQQTALDPTRSVDPSNLLGFAPQPSGLDALIMGQGASAAQLPPSPMAQPVAQVQQLQPAASAVVGQKQLIEAFTALGSAPGKGPDAIRAVLAKFNVATVTAIPAEQYANAVAACKQVLAG